MALNGYIKLYRKLLDWGWYEDTNTTRVFLHLLLTANFRETKYEGVIIHPGQTVIGRKSLAKKLGLSERQIRTSLNHLISTNEVTIKTTNRFSVATIVNWASYQLDDDEPTTETATNCANDRPATDHTLRREEYKNRVGGVIGPEIWSDFMEWVEMREKIGKPILTQKAVTRAVNKLNSLSDDPEIQRQIIHDSINNNWLSFYPLKGSSRPNGSNGKSNGKAKELEDTYAMIEEWANGSN